jgi:hypothetical protein
MPILYLKNNATTAKSVRPTGYTFPTGLNQVFSANTATDYLVVAGGGGGGSLMEQIEAGGGGAGGYLTGTTSLGVSTALYCDSWRWRCLVGLEVLPENCKQEVLIHLI